MTATPGHYFTSMTPDPTTRITPREREILYLLASGIPRREVADLWGLSLQTIHTNLAHLYERWQVRTLESALVRAIVGEVFTLEELRAADAAARRRWEASDG